MDIQNAASVIKGTVDMQTILGLYGYRSKHGFIVCPFHGDRDASLKIYSNNGRHGGWHCFGCGRGGSVIDFVMARENCDFVTAVKAIDIALGMDLLKRQDLFTERARKREQERLDRVRKAFDDYADALFYVSEMTFREKFRQLREIEDKPVPERNAVEWTRLLTLPEDLQEIEEVQDRIRDLKERVMTWRNKARRAT